jgi:hypothetical protein
MPSPIIVLKTKTGYACFPYLGELPLVNFADASCFSELHNAYGTNAPGTLFGELKEHFEPSQPSVAGEK